uniref:Ig-like domain-containing protein n=1 Tax=Monopterus albus TaxID=43700 RepID=A0A3Q3J390_MONAL
MAGNTGECGNPTYLVSCLPLFIKEAVSESEFSETTLSAAPGDIAQLPCYTLGNVTPSLTTWTKNGQEVIRGGGSSPSYAPAGDRFTVLYDGSLSIKEVIPGDEGSYLCNSRLPGNNTFQTRVLLQVTNGPENVSVSIGPATALSNGTLITYRGSNVSFNCSGSSYPSQQLTWAFRGDSSSNDSLVSTSGSWLDFRIEDIQPSAQGVYSCIANNTVSHQEVNKSAQLLVYYIPDKHPECMWVAAQYPSHIQFNCSWFGAYPTPTLHWEFSPDAHMVVPSPNKTTFTKSETLHISLIYSTPHTIISLLCLLEPPFPEGDPLAMAVEATSITLTCTETSSIPPANTTWRKGLQQEEIVSGSKYVLSVEGPNFKLTIFNISKDDEGVYFCRSENVLAVSELEVYLTVKPSSVNTGVIIGIFIAALIVGAAAVVAKTVYSSRHQICLVDDDGGDVLNLVESDDEQIFQDTVPQLPPLTNGCHTTLVQIHRIPSNSTPSSWQFYFTEEPVDLVSF